MHLHLHGLCLCFCTSRAAAMHNKGTKSKEIRWCGNKVEERRWTGALLGDQTELLSPPITVSCIYIVRTPDWLVRNTSVKYGGRWQTEREILDTEACGSLAVRSVPPARTSSPVPRSGGSSTTTLSACGPFYRASPDGRENKGRNRQK